MTLLLATLATWLLLYLVLRVVVRRVIAGCVVSDPWEQRRMAMGALAGNDEGRD